MAAAADDLIRRLPPSARSHLVRLLIWDPAWRGHPHVPASARKALAVRGLIVLNQPYDDPSGADSRCDQVTMLGLAVGEELRKRGWNTAAARRPR